MQIFLICPKTVRETSWRVSSLKQIFPLAISQVLVLINWEMLNVCEI